MKYLSRQSSRLLLVALLILGPATGHAQEPERWFQVEVSVFSNERQADRDEEVWSPERTTLGYPDNLQSLRSLFSILMTQALQPASTGSEILSPEEAAESPDDISVVPSAQDVRREILAATGPFPPASGDGYRFPDFSRDAFLQLPASESDFQQTNRALERSPEHRLLFHSVWRQPVPDPGGELPVAIRGGDRFGEHWELEGSLSFHFNANRDRVVVDSNLWLTEFVLNRQSGTPRSLAPEIPGATTDREVALQQQEPGWQIPDLPAQLASVVVTPELAAGADSQRENQSAIAATRYEPTVIYHLDQSREMRSDEFHYVDHPALGVIVTVFPYEVPPLPETPVTETAAEPDDSLTNL